jgi:hypothetical protein
MKMKSILSLLLVTSILATVGCKQTGSSDAANPLYNEVSTPSSEQSAAFMIEWWKQLFSFVASEKLSPPDASRMFAYIATAMYEAQVAGSPDYMTLEGQLNGLEGLPRPDKDLEYDWTTVTIETAYYVQDEMLGRYLPAGVGAINNLHDRQMTERMEVTSEEVINRSKEYGRALADAIIAWSETDGYTETRYKQFKAPSREGHPEFWEPTDFNQTALEPFWGTHRTFAVPDNKKCDIDMSFPYSEEKDSEFYKQAMEVYTVDKNLTEEQRIIAQYWADDPGETATPPGHWMYIAGNFVQAEEWKLDKAAEMYALTAISMQDACISLWHTKYRVNLVRPKTYINEQMEPGWEPYVETPPFPGYTSGHSGFSGAAAEVMTALIGDNKPFIDSTHVQIGLEPKEFESFRAAAEEAAYSRMYGGIHYTCEIQDGLVQGQCAGNYVLNDIVTDTRRQGKQEEGVAIK